jgi:hypothetical protein
MRYILTAVEKLFPDHRGLEYDLDGLFRRGIPQGRIQSIVRKKHGVVIPLPQIWKFRVKRWIPREQRINGHAERWEGFMRAFKRQAYRRQIRSLPRPGRCWRRKDLTKVLVLAAQELYGANWQEALGARLSERFGTADLPALTPAQARSEIEALLSRLAAAWNENSEVVRGFISADFRQGQTRLSFK